MEKKETESPNYFVRSLIVLMCVLTAGMIIYNFFFTEPRGEVNAGLITLVAILVVIVLSESFDNFSVGKIIAISRENKKKGTAINRLSGENEELRKQIINIATSVNQSQSSTNIFGFPEDGIKKFIVQRASEEELQERETEESSAADQARAIRRRPDFRKIEELAMNKFLTARKLDEYSLIKEAKLVTQFHGIDSVSNTQPIYDGYLNTGEEEVFIEVRPSFSHIMMWRERVYVMLNKIHLYRSIKKSNAYLSLVFVNVLEEITDRPARNDLHRIEEYFEPAIANGLLRIFYIELTKEEGESCMKEMR